jgi:hypothetical protein
MVTVWDGGVPEFGDTELMIGAFGVSRLNPPTTRKTAIWSRVTALFGQ